MPTATTRTRSSSWRGASSWTRSRAKGAPASRTTAAVMSMGCHRGVVGPGSSDDPVGVEAVDVGLVDSEAAEDVVGVLAELRGETVGDDSSVADVDEPARLPDVPTGRMRGLGDAAAGQVARIAQEGPVVAW